MPAPLRAPTIDAPTDGPRDADPVADFPPAAPATVVRISGGGSIHLAILTQTKLRVGRQPLEWLDPHRQHEPKQLVTSVGRFDAPPEHLDPFDGACQLAAIRARDGG